MVYECPGELGKGSGAQRVRRPDWKRLRAFSSILLGESLGFLFKTDSRVIPAARELISKAISTRAPGLIFRKVFSLLLGGALKVFAFIGLTHLAPTKPRREIKRPLRFQEPSSAIEHYRVYLPSLRCSSSDMQESVSSQQKGPC